MEHINSWRDSEKVFQQQLTLNMRELQLGYPTHWNHFLTSLSMIKENFSIERVFDIGCGVGVYSELCRRHFPSLKYIGCDYSEVALKIASNHWLGSSTLFKGEYQDLTPDMFRVGDVLVANGLLDILPNGDEAVEHFLSLGIKHVIFQRINLTNSPSFHKVYKAYDVIDTYQYHHQISNLADIIERYGYQIENQMELSESENVNLLIVKDD